MWVTEVGWKVITTEWQNQELGELSAFHLHRLRYLVIQTGCYVNEDLGKDIVFDYDS